MRRFACTGSRTKTRHTYHVPWLDPRDRRSSELEPIAIEVETEKAREEVASEDNSIMRCRCLISLLNILSHCTTYNDHH